MALTAQQEADLLALLATAPADNQSLHLAPDAGDPASTTNIAVQQVAAQASSLIQKMPISSLGITTTLTGIGRGIDTKFMTGAGFIANLGTVDDYGTLKVCTDAAVQAKVLNDRAIVPANVDAMFLNEIPAPTQIDPSDVVLGSTDGTGSALNVYKSTYGNRGTLEGNFTFVPNISGDTIDIVINNVYQPLFTISGTGYLSSASNPTERHAMAVQFESVGTPVSGGGQVKLTLGRGTASWASGVSYDLGIAINYAAKI